MRPHMLLNDNMLIRRAVTCFLYWFYHALVLFEQSNCINWINFCYILLLTKM